MKIEQVVAYGGPNVWAPVPVLEATVDLAAHGHQKSDEHPHLIARLETWLDSLDEPIEVAKLQGREQLPSPGVDDEFFEELKRGISIAPVLAHVVRLLETVAGTPPDFLAHEAVPATSLIKLAFQFEEEAVARAALNSAVALVTAALGDQDFDVILEKRKLVDLADDARLGPSTRAITQAAKRRGIPVRRLNDGSLVQLGEGCFQRRIWTAETDATSAIAEAIAQDKDLTKAFLSAVGVPVPRGRAVTDADDAWAAALEIGLPVAVKPRDANHGRGISLDLTTQTDVAQGFRLALAESDRGVMVEKYARGSAYRLLVIGDRLVAAARGQVEYVTGDGKSSIEELVAEVNRDPRRGANYTNPLDYLSFNDSALLELRNQGFTRQSIPPANKKVLLRRNGDLTTDCTSEVHPQVAQQAVLAAQVVGLDIAGLDVIAEDISQPLEGQGGVIVEVNAGPGLSHHVAPLYGEPQPVGDAIIDLIFPNEARARMTLLGVTGSGPRSQVVSVVSTHLTQSVPNVSAASTAGVFHRGRRIAACGKWDTANVQALLMHPKAEAAVFESRPDQARARGIGCERCDVVVVTPTDDPRDLLGAIATVRAVPTDGTAVLPAECLELDQLIAACRGTVVLYAADPAHPRLRTHRASGGRIVFLDGRRVMLGHGTLSSPSPHDPTTFGTHDLQTVILPAIAAISAFRSA